MTLLPPSLVPLILQRLINFVATIRDTRARLVYFKTTKNGNL